MAKSKNLLSKFSLVGIDLECFKTYFNMKVSKSKIFAHVMFFLGLCQDLA